MGFLLAVLIGRATSPGRGIDPQATRGYPNPAFTAIILIEPEAKGTRYRAVVMHPDEASRTQHEAMGFHQGWCTAFDQLVAHQQDVVLLGRVTYEEWSRFWPSSTNEPFSSFINTTQKHVASSSLQEASWRNTTVTNDIAATIADLKKAPGADIGVHGSIELVRWLLRNDLLDELRLAMFPSIAGTGRRLFEGFETAQPLDFIRVDRTAQGVLMLSYRPLPAGHHRCKSGSANVVQTFYPSALENQAVTIAQQAQLRKSG